MLWESTYFQRQDNSHDLFQTFCFLPDCSQVIFKLPDQSRFPNFFKKVETLQQLSFDAPTLSAKLHKAGRSLEQTSFHPMLEQLNGRR